MIQDLSAQVPKEFEFLDHRSRKMSHLDSKIFEDSRFFVAERHSTWPMTTVNVFDMETNEIDTILNSFYGQSDLTEFLDGSFDFYLHSMFDYDVCVSGFMHVAYDGTAFTVDTFHSYIIPEVGFENNVYPISVSKNRDGGYYMVDGDSLFVSNRVTAIGLRKVDFSVRLFQNEAQDVYLYGGSNIVRINGTEFDTVQVLDDRLIEIKNRGDFNDVLLENSVQLWNDDFSQLIRTWPINETFESFYQVDVGETLLTALSPEPGEDRYYSIDESGNELDLKSGSLVNEDAFGFHALSDSTLVLINHYQIDEIESQHMIYRHIDYQEDFNYQSRAVSVDSFTFVFTGSDTLDVFVTSSGDTMVWLDDFYQLRFQYTNHSGISVNHLNAITSQVHSDFYFLDGGLNFEFKDELLPNEVVVRDTVFNTPYGSPTMVYIAIPGADYRINNHPDRILVTNVVLDVPNIVFDENITIYPNPTSDMISLKTESKIEQVSIYNSQGQLMVKYAGYQNLDNINVQNLQAGTYFIKLRLKNSKNDRVQKFVKL